MRILRDDLDRKIVRLAIPALGTLAVEPLYILVDTAIVGRLGTPQLAGLAIASIVLLNVISVLSFLEYVTPDIAFAVGAGRVEDARQVATNGLWLSLAIGVPSSARRANACGQSGGAAALHLPRAHARRARRPVALVSRG